MDYQEIKRLWWRTYLENMESCYSNSTFTLATVNKKYGSDSFTNTFSKKITDGTITYESSNTEVASVDSKTGKVTIKAAGTVTITATSEVSKNYKAGKASYKLTIAKAKNTITANNVTKKKSKKVQTFSLGAKVKGGAKLTYKSNNKSVKVNSAGKVTIAKNYSGKATITITAFTTSNYKQTIRKVTITVKK
jgi:hypothetical protein